MESGDKLLSDARPGGIASSSGVSSAGKKILASNLPGGAYRRPAFESRRLSPRLNPEVGGSGSCTEHSIVLGKHHTPDPER